MVGIRDLGNSSLPGRIPGDIGLDGPSLRRRFSLNRRLLECGSSVFSFGSEFLTQGFSLCSLCVRSGWVVGFGPCHTCPNQADLLSGCDCCPDCELFVLKLGSGALASSEECDLPRIRVSLELTRIRFVSDLFRTWRRK